MDGVRERRAVGGGGERCSVVGSMVGRSSPSLAGAILGGLGGSAAIMAVNQAADRLDLTDLDLARVLGLTFRDPGNDGLTSAGLAWYFAAGGVLVPTLYWLGFRLLGRAGASVGLGLGAGHYLLSGIILGLTTPRRPKCSRGRGRPMGSFVSAYGPLERTANLAGHMAYGLLVGMAAR